MLPLLLACNGPLPDTAAPPTCAEGTYSRDSELTLSSVQALGTHNSTHIEPDELVSPSHAYTHAALDVQLADQGVRALELDLHYREGEGLQVFHLPIIDEETTCLAFADCLALIAAWSAANPCHSPLMIWLEPKDEDLDTLDETLLSLLDRHEEIEDAIRAGVGESQVITPDEVRGDWPTLSEAITAQGWPTLDTLRGRMLFSLLDSGDHRDTYLDGAPSLEGRLLFVDADSTSDPFAATLKIDSGLTDAEAITAAVSAGFLVTSNTDSAEDSDADNAARLAATLAAGSHFLASDFPAAVDGRDYTAAIPGGAPVGCNPVAAPADCLPADLE